MKMKINYSWLAFIAGAVLLSAILHFPSPNIPDPDSFYHLRHSWIYRSVSLFNVEFPWTVYSIIGEKPADIWYGFHLLLIPFTYFSNLIMGIKLSGVILTSLLVLAIGWAGLRQKLELPFFWPFLALLAVPNALFQALMVRPQLISLALSALLPTFLINGAWWQVFLISAGISFFHLNFFWIVPVILAVVETVTILNGLKIDWKKAPSVFGGLAVGWLAQPNPLNALKIIYVQIFQLLFEKQFGEAILFSKELAPLSFLALLKTAGIFLFLWLIAAIVVFWLKLKNKNVSVFFWSNLAISFIFLLFTLFLARRSLILWVVFGALAIASAYILMNAKKSLKEAFSWLMIGSFLITLFYSFYQINISLARNAAPPDYLQESALWLKNNSQPKDIVFNTHWDNFSALFFWNQNNYYIGGMDPIFQYAYDQGLYWKFHWISKDDLERAGDIQKILKEDFKAKYILVEKRRNPRLNQWLEFENGKFERVFQNQKESIFLVK